MLAWENSWHFTMPPLVPCKETSEKWVQKCHTDDVLLPRSCGGGGQGGRWVLGYSRFQVTEMIEGFLGVWNFWFCSFLRLENLGGLIKVGIFWVLKTVWRFLCVTVEPWYNKVPTDWQNLFAIMRFCYIEVPFHMFYYYWGEENRLLHWGQRFIILRYRGSTVYHLTISGNF